MHVIVVYNHPYEGSYCRALLEATLRGLERGGHTADVIDLDADGFDPSMSRADLRAFVRAPEVGAGTLEALSPRVQNYARRLQRADHLVFIFPIWWELMPARTKGFIDRVVFPGVAYEYTRFGMRSLLRLSGVTLVTTMNTPRPAYRWLFGDAVSRALLRGTFWKIGVPNRRWVNLSLVKQARPEQRRRWLEKLESRFARLRPPRRMFGGSRASSSPPPPRPRSLEL